MKRSLRTAVFGAVAVLEILAAATILLIGYQLPSALEVEAAVGSAREMASISRNSAATLQNRMQALETGSQELARAMSDIATGLDMIAAVEIPIVTLSGVTPRVRWQHIWPSNYNPAERFRKIAAASKAGEEVTTEFAVQLPELQATISQMEIALGQYGAQTAHALGYARVLMWMVALLIALHGCFLLIQEASASTPAPTDQSRFRPPHVVGEETSC